MPIEPLSKALKPQMIETRIAELKNEEVLTRTRRDLKSEAGEPTDSETARLEELQGEIAALSEELARLRK